MKKKKIIIGIAIILVTVILLAPMPPIVVKDGGSKVYKALTYKVYKYHTLQMILIDENGNSVNGDPGYHEGMRVEVFGIGVFDNYNDRYSENGEIYLKGTGDFILYFKYLMRIVKERFAAETGDR